jgi:hypothetical protein
MNPLYDQALNLTRLRFPGTTALTLGAPTIKPMMGQF